MAQVGIILGSDSDLPKIKECFSILDELNIEYEVKIASAHRTPEAALAWTKTAEERGIKVIIAVAGGAAHLPGVVAAHTTLPVVGVPIETAVSGGLDSILSIIQMPSGIPVAAMPAGRAGGPNAALYAAQIIGISDSSIKERILSYRNKTREKIEARNNKLKEQGVTEYIKSLEAK